MSVRISKDAPEPIVDIAEVMSTFPGWWALCGGWAGDAWIGTITRPHGDIDIAIRQDEQRLLFEHLRGWQLIAHDVHTHPGDTARRWDGGWLELPAHIHGGRSDAVTPTDHLDDTAQGFFLDVQLEDCRDNRWIFNPDVVAAVDDCVAESRWGVPALVPRVLLVFKGGLLRDHDRADFECLLPLLDDSQRRWLYTALPADHPWRTAL